MRAVSSLSRRVGGSLLLSVALLLVLALPAAAETAPQQAESTDLLEASGLSVGTLFWGIAGAAALIVGWAMTRRPSGAREPEQVLASD